jgi:signal transduction histidine kinase
MSMQIHRRISGRIKQDVALQGGLMSAMATIFSVLLLCAFFWWFLIERLEDRVENALTARHEVALANEVSLSDEERQVIRRFRKSLPVRDEGVFAWVDQQGVTFSGSVAGLDCRAGFYDRWLDVSKSPSDEPVPALTSKPSGDGLYDRFRFLSKQRGDNCLVFGRSLYEVDATRESVVGLLLWLVPLCLLPALFISLRRSWLLRRRLQSVGQVVQAVSDGDFGARIPVSGNDDIDRLALSANHSFERLQDSVNTLHQLTSVIAHDLRSPLNRVIIPLDKALRANESGQTDSQSIEQVKQGLADAQGIFDALLRISQIESGSRRANFSSTDLFELAEMLFEVYQPVVEDASRTLEFEVTGQGSSIIQGDEDLLKQALVNLIENAVRYTPEGSVIRIGVIRYTDGPNLVVTDNGPGLPSEERPRVLQRLYRYHGSAGDKNGHGLGLSLVKAVADLHYARITLEDSNPGLLVRLVFSGGPQA